MLPETKDFLCVQAIAFILACVIVWLEDRFRKKDRLALKE